ncbi:MAG: hypothetical protein P8L46_09555 [Acidimicrobiales bacterium]|nr:hypothetical protein [Acidimicrobiales bacterium]MDG2218276.1 hypothetical protein [Acidimicrobiales bacterium]
MADGKITHDRLHRHAASLVASGANVRAVADRLDHADAGSTLQTYAHASPERDHAVAAAIEAFQLFL